MENKEKPKADVQATWRKFGWIPLSEKKVVDEKIKSM